MRPSSQNKYQRRGSRDFFSHGTILMRILSWNMAHRQESWRHLLAKPPDIALLQEACEPPADTGSKVITEQNGWTTAGRKLRPWKTTIVSFGPTLETIPAIPLADALDGEFGVSRLGTLAAAHVATASEPDPITLVSMYGLWEKPHRLTGSAWIYADASVHRSISDISVLVGQEKGHRIIAAGDLNILYDYGEHGNAYWHARYQSIFERFKSIGLDFVGPQSPNGRSAEPWPSELPVGSLNVPTYYSTRQKPATATRQLDFVFASRDIARRVTTRALNGLDEWGPSDHCMIEINVSK